MYDGIGNADREHEFTGESTRADGGLPLDLSSRVLTVITDTADWFVQVGYCPPHALVIDGQGEVTTVLPECLSDEEGEESFIDAIKKTIDEQNGVAAVYMAEGWMPGENWDGVTSPDQCADQRKAIRAVVDALGGSATFIWQIHRDADGVRLGECEVTGTFCDGQRFEGLLRRTGNGQS